MPSGGTMDSAQSASSKLDCGQMTEKTEPGQYCSSQSEENRTVSGEGSRSAVS
jgi:hypothetical protein